jgi:plastocyanin
MFRVAIVAALAGLGILVTGCGGTDTSAPSVPIQIQGAAAASNTNVIIRNFTFQKPAITVPAGTSITWTNQDSSIHTVTAADRSFDSGNLAQGQTFSHVFRVPGTYAYRCNIHQYMTGTVVVTG